MFLHAIVVGVFLLYLLLRATRQGNELKAAELVLKQVALEREGRIPISDPARLDAYREEMDRLRYVEVEERGDQDSPSVDYRADLKEMTLEMTVTPLTYGDEQIVRDYHLRRTEAGRWEVKETEKSVTRVAEQAKREGVDPYQAPIEWQWLGHVDGLEDVKLDTALARFRDQWRDVG